MGRVTRQGWCVMPIKELPIIVHYGKQRFNQFNSMDSANFSLVQDSMGKKKVAMYPTMGRRNVEVDNKKLLNFEAEPRAIFRSINFGYAVVRDKIYKFGDSFTPIDISNSDFTGFNKTVWFTYLPTPTKVYAIFTDGNNMYIYDETSAGLMATVTDSRAPSNPTFVAAFGNRIVCSNADSTQFNVTRLNLDNAAAATAATNCFSFGTPAAAIFAQESGKIRQMAVLHNQLYIFTDFDVGIWSNSPTSLSSSNTVIPFPFRKNTSYNFDFGIADPNSLDVDFGMMVWLGQSRNGLVEFVMSTGGRPESIQDKSIDVLLENKTAEGNPSPFLTEQVNGFLYQYENSVFYRASAGRYSGTGYVDCDTEAASIEHNFDTKTWTRCIELNGERCRVEKHIYLNNKHLVTVQNDTSIYEFDGRTYVNYRRNSDNSVPITSNDFYVIDPMRYIAITPLIFEPDYSEFITDWVQIDFVWGRSGVVEADLLYANTTFIITEDADGDGEPIYVIAEDSDSDGNPIYLITEDSDTPSAGGDIHYRNYFRPHVELYYSDDGGETYLQADVRHFSDIGFYRWRMRWYELGSSRNRVYKLVCVSVGPMVVLGGIMSTRPASGGAR
jgi:hypothetical protein